MTRLHDGRYIGRSTSKGTFGAIKHRALLMDEEENVLEQVVRFRIVPEDLVPDRPHQARITVKEATQGLLIPIDGASHFSTSSGISMLSTE